MELRAEPGELVELLLAVGRRIEWTAAPFRKLLNLGCLAVTTPKKSAIPRYCLWFLVFFAEGGATPPVDTLAPGSTLLMALEAATNMSA